MAVRFVTSTVQVSEDMLLRDARGSATVYFMMQTYRYLQLLDLNKHGRRSLYYAAASDYAGDRFRKSSLLSRAHTVNLHTAKEGEYIAIFAVELHSIAWQP